MKYSTTEKTPFSYFCWCLLATLLCATTARAQPLTVEQIMQGADFIGHWPDNVRWHPAGERVYFEWNPEGALADSLYTFTVSDPAPRKLTPAERRAAPTDDGRYDAAYRRYVYSQGGDIYLLDLRRPAAPRRLTDTPANEFEPRFGADGQSVVFRRENNLYRLSLTDGAFAQLTDFRAGDAPDTTEADPDTDTQRGWLREQQRRLMGVLSERAEKERLTEERAAYDRRRQGVIYYGKGTLNQPQLSPDERFVTFQTVERPDDPSTSVPNYVTEDGYTADLTARPKVGGPPPTSAFFVHDLRRDTTYRVPLDSLPGVRQRPAFYRDYDADAPDTLVQPKNVLVYGPTWSEGGARAVLVGRSGDNKDRWLLLLDAAAGRVRVLNHQHDEAWIGGPGVGSYGGMGNVGWLDERTVWFQSEKTGYSHLYAADVVTETVRALTSGNYEIQEATLSRDKRTFYLQTNAVHPGEQHVYHLDVASKRLTKVSPDEAGAYRAVASPDGRYLAVRRSSSAEPWDLYLMRNRAGASPRRVTTSPTAAFRAYPWCTPEVVTFEARDGAAVHARLYQPYSMAPNSQEATGRAVIFVHGAGYLQNAHRYWSRYYREYMFHNLLVERGYTVLDIDYRGSDGYGRDWRTGIYRHMGGKDLTDQVDGARYLVAEHGVDPARIGIYGGSYGGFITLMALFTEAETFAAGAALRSVTDWAHYNHGYTANILNEPTTDSLAYARSSPIYFAEGLADPLLICHGMVDTNVQFQDVVRLAQRLIELGKEDWELAVYPVEGHGFEEPSSWTDEYRRILELFETRL